MKQFLLFLSIIAFSITLSAQNVGIGKASPESKLDVDGDLRGAYGLNNNFESWEYIGAMTGVTNDVADHVILLCRTGSGASGTTNSIFGEIYGKRVSGHRSSGIIKVLVNQTTSGVPYGTVTGSLTQSIHTMRLVTCDYGGQSYVALEIISSADFQAWTQGVWFRGNASSTGERLRILTRASVTNINPSGVIESESRYFSSSNVGIGTVSPGAKLHVTGSIRFQGLAGGSETNALMIDGGGNVSSRSLNIANWDAAFGWGNHASAGYLTSFSETDPSWSGTPNTTSDLTRTGNVGIGTGTPRGLLNLSRNSSVSDPSDISSYPLTISYPTDDNSGQTGIAFRISSNQTADRTPGAAIVHNRVGANSTGGLLFKTNPTTTGTGSLVTRMTIDQNGNVGINAASPGARFHVDGSVRLQGLGTGTETSALMIDGSGNVSTRSLNIANWDAAFGWGNHASAGYLTSFSETDPSWTGTANTTSVITRTGNVGIGSANTPGATLQVTAGGAGPITRFHAYGNANPSVIIESENNAPGMGVIRLRQASNNTDRVVFTSNSGSYWSPDAGNVGIGTTSPSNLLHVNGIARIGGVTFDNPDANSAILIPSRGTAGTERVYMELMGVFANDAANENGGGFIKFRTSTASGYGPEIGGIRRSGGTGDMIFKTGGISPSERMRILDNGNVGIGLTAPAHRLHVEGNARVNGYILAGNPTAPQSTSSAIVDFYRTGNEGFAGWTSQSVCGPTAADWRFWYPGSTSLNNYVQYDNQGSRSRKNIISPWIWIPTGSTSISALGHFYNNLESGWDGVFLEYTTNGSSWTKITGFLQGGYNNTSVVGSNTACSGGDTQAAWSNSGWTLFVTNSLSIAGNWVRFRFVGFEDASNATGSFDLYLFAVEGNGPASGGSFAAGNIYAQNNVYAGSNVLQGDIAEYFPITGASEPGNVISIDPLIPDRYRVTDKANDSYILGVHSTNPTVTLNDPNSGVPVALRGRVPVKISGENGPVKPGDILTSASVKGHATKAISPCYMVGRALEYFDGNGTGVITCLVENGWYNPGGGTPVSSGTFAIQKGSREITVNDESVGSNSKIFITLLGDPGARYWVSKKADGQFVISLSENSSVEVDFDYMVENSRTDFIGKPTESESNANASVSNEKPARFNEDGWQYDKEKNIYWKMEEPRKPAPGERVESVPANTSDEVPPVPEDPTQRYIHLPGKGTIPFSPSK